MRSVYKFFLEYIREMQGMEFLAKPLAATLCVVIIIIVAWLAHFITRNVFLRIVTRIAKRTKTDWDDILVKNKV